jgi:predicted naringenin-chalcone synthase
VTGTAIIIGLATSAPPGVIEQQEAAEHAIPRCCNDEREARLLRKLYTQTGIDRRGSTLINPDNPDAHEQFFPRSAGTQESGPTTAQRMETYSQMAPALAGRAAADAIDDAGVDTSQITHLITVSCTGFEAPGIDINLCVMLGLSRTVERTHVGFMGCHGALNGLRIAKAIAESQPNATVLLVAVELCSLHFQHGADAQRIVANALFADGAAAVIIRARTPGDRDPQGYEIAATGACVFPESTDAMTWKITDHGFAMSLSPKTPGLIGDHLRPWINDWLDTCGVSGVTGISAIRSWAIHPGGPRLVTAAEHALDLGPSDTRCSRDVLREHGNMSSPTILFILDRMRRANASRPIVALGFGPGLSVELMLLV